MNSETYCMVIIEGVTEGDYDSYRKDVEAAGFIQSTFESADETSKMYSGSKDDKNNITICYSATDKSITVTSAISE